VTEEICIEAPLNDTGGIEFPEENWGRSDDLKEVGEVDLRTSLGLAFGSDNTYTYSVRDPRSDRERYMRVAPMALRSPSQNHFVLGRVPRRGRGRGDVQNGG